MTGLAQLSQDFHSEIQKYITLKESWKISRTCINLYPSYHHFKWKHTVVMADYFSPKVLYSNKMLIPMAIFVHHKSFSWFPNEYVQYVDFIWDALRDVLKLGKLAPHVAKDYPRMIHFAFKITGDFSKLFLVPDFSHNLKKYLSKIPSVSLHMNRGNGECKSNINLCAYEHNNTLPLDLDCTGINIYDLNLDIENYYSLRILNLQCNLRQLILSYSMSAEKYIKLFQSFSNLINLDTLYVYLCNFNAVHTMSSLPNHISTCRLVLTNSFDFEDNVERSSLSPITIPQVTEIRCLQHDAHFSGDQEDDDEGNIIVNSIVSGLKLSFWEAFKFPQLKGLYLNKYLDQTIRGYSFVWIPNSTCQFLSNLSIFFYQTSDCHGFLYTLPTMKCLENLEILGLYCKEIEYNHINPSAISVKNPINEVVIWFFNILTLELRKTYKTDHFVRLLFDDDDTNNNNNSKKSMMSVQNIQSKWESLFGGPEIFVKLISKIICNPKDYLFWFCKALENNVYDYKKLKDIRQQEILSRRQDNPTGEINMKNLITDRLNRVKDEEKDDIGFVPIRNCDSSSYDSILPPEVTFRDFVKSLIIRTVKETAKESCYHDLKNWEIARENFPIDLIGVHFDIIQNLFYLLFLDSLFETALESLSNLKVLKLPLISKTVATPRFFNLAHKHKTLESIILDVETKYLIDDKSCLNSFLQGSWMGLDYYLYNLDDVFDPENNEESKEHYDEKYSRDSLFTIDIKSLRMKYHDFQIDEKNCCVNNKSTIEIYRNKFLAHNYPDSIHEHGCLCNGGAKIQKQGIPSLFKKKDEDILKKQTTVNGYEIETIDIELDDDLSDPWASPIPGQIVNGRYLSSRSRSLLKLNNNQDENKEIFFSVNAQIINKEMKSLCGDRDCFNYMFNNETEIMDL